MSGVQSTESKATHQHVEDAMPERGAYAVIQGKEIPLQDVLRASTASFAPYARQRATHKFGNPAAFGLSAFGVSTLCLSIYNFYPQGIHLPNGAVAMGFFVGGIGQFLSGQWEIVAENSFAACAMTGFGCFWMSFGAISTPSFGIQAAYADDPEQLNNVLGFFSLAWSVFSVMLSLCVIRSTYIFALLFLTLSMTFILQTAYYFTMNEAILKASAVFGVLLAFCAFFSALGGLANKSNTYSFLIPKPYNLPTAPEIVSFEEDDDDEDL